MKSTSLAIEKRIESRSLSVTAGRSMLTLGTLTLLWEPMVPSLSTVQ